MASKHHLKCQIWSWYWFLKVTCSEFWAVFGLHLGSLGKKCHDWWWWLPCCLSANPSLSNVRELHEGIAQRQGEQNARKGNFPFFPVLLWAAHAVGSEKAHTAGQGQPGLWGNTPGPSGGPGNAPILSGVFQEISFFLGRLNSCSWNSSLHTLSYFITWEKILKKSKAIRRLWKACLVYLTHH